jgi:hypothetical protein
MSTKQNTLYKAVATHHSEQVACLSPPYAVACTSPLSVETTFKRVSHISHVFLKAVNEAERSVSLPDQAQLLARCSWFWDCCWDSFMSALTGCGHHLSLLVLLMYCFVTLLASIPLSFFYYTVLPHQDLHAKITTETR